MKFLKKRYAYASVLGLLLTGSFSYSMLKTFVLAETISTVATTSTSSNAAAASQAAKTATDKRVTAPATIFFFILMKTPL